MRWAPAEQMTMEAVLGLIRDLGWTPAAVLDIGVERGTRGLYSIWPGAPICLVEPSPRALVFMQQIAERYPNVSIYNVGASNHTGEAQGSLHPELVNVSIGEGKANWASSSFKVMTCDDIVRDAGLEGPFLYKLDTDAHEREVLEGSADTLAQSDVCVVEMTVYNARRGRITPDEIWRVMYDKGFVMFDIIGPSRSAAGVLRGMDMVFIRADSELAVQAWRYSTKTAARLKKRIEQQEAAAIQNDMID